MRSARPRIWSGEPPESSASANSRSAWIGWRRSWLAAARKRDFAVLAAIAASRASASWLHDLQLERALGFLERLVGAAQPQVAVPQRQAEERGQQRNEDHVDGVDGGGRYTRQRHRRLEVAGDREHAGDPDAHGDRRDLELARAVGDRQRDRQEAHQRHHREDQRHQQAHDQRHHPGAEGEAPHRRFALSALREFLRAAHDDGRAGLGHRHHRRDLRGEQPADPEHERGGGDVAPEVPGQETFELARLRVCDAHAPQYPGTSAIP
jgi:hypothetical protein